MLYFSLLQLTLQWEDYYLQKINAARKTEVQKERQELMNKIAGFMMIFVAPVLAMLLSLVTFQFTSGTPPMAHIVFSLLALFNTLRYPLLLLPSAERTFTGIFPFQFMFSQARKCLFHDWKNTVDSQRLMNHFY